MVSAYKQDYSYPMVYRCPQCGEMEVFKFNKNWVTKQFGGLAKEFGDPNLSASQ